jgi:hypothetical protein
VLSIIAGIVEAIWTVVSFLLLPAIIIEDMSFGDAAWSAAPPGPCWASG